MAVYEYKYLFHPYGSLDADGFTSLLNQYGADGWQVVHLSFPVADEYGHSDKPTVVYFMREKQYNLVDYQAMLQKEQAAAHKKQCLSPVANGLDNRIYDDLHPYGHGYEYSPLSSVNKMDNRAYGQQSYGCGNQQVATNQPTSDPY